MEGIQRLVLVVWECPNCPQPVLFHIDTSTVDTIEASSRLTLAAHQAQHQEP